MTGQSIASPPTRVRPLYSQHYQLMTCQISFVMMFILWSGYDYMYMHTSFVFLTLAHTHMFSDLQHHIFEVQCTYVYEKYMYIHGIVYIHYMHIHCIHGHACTVSACWVMYMETLHIWHRTIFPEHAFGDRCLEG